MTKIHASKRATKFRYLTRIACARNSQFLSPPLSQHQHILTPPQSRQDVSDNTQRPEQRAVQTRLPKVSPKPIYLASNMSTNDNNSSYDAEERRVSPLFRNVVRHDGRGFDIGWGSVSLGIERSLVDLCRSEWSNVHCRFGQLPSPKMEPDWTFGIHRGGWTWQWSNTRSNRIGQFHLRRPPRKHLCFRKQ